jgi:hypothetical protein
MDNPDINNISNHISDLESEPLVTVSGYGRMTKKQALQSTITYLRQMAEMLEQGSNIPLNYFDMAKDHYLAFIDEPTHY